MFRILIANSKGGSGKTTLTTTLAGYYARAGRLATLLDCDPQGSSLAWSQLRGAQHATVRTLASSDPANGLGTGWVLRLPSDTQVLLIDTPAGLRAHEFVPFARHADVLLVPVVPSPLDLHATLGFLDGVRRLPEVRQGLLRVGLIANRLRERTVAARDLDATLQRLTQTCLIRVRDSQLYLRLAAVGMSLFDDNSSTTRGHREDWQPLLDWLSLRESERRREAKVAFLPAAAKKIGN
ncbi:MAG: ParA family protein [Rhodanobacteraceae bacterium]|nr:ParA family protein [Rhodanobacteraceae bacterium]